MDGGWLGCVTDARDYFSRATFLAGFFYYIFYFQTPDETRSTISQRENTGSVKTCELATVWLAPPRGHSLLWPKRKAPPEKGTLFGLRVHERVGISLVEVYKRVEKSVILSVKGAKMANRRILLMWKETLTSWCSDFFILKDAEFASVKREVNLWNGYYLSIERVREKNLFCQKWYTKRYAVGPQGGAFPYNTLLSSKAPGLALALKSRQLRNGYDSGSRVADKSG